MRPEELNELLRRDCLRVVQHLLPAGKAEGPEWVVGSVMGEAGSSCKIRCEGEKIGLWKDFASGQGGDLIELWRLNRGKTFVETLAEIHEFLGVKQEKKKEKSFQQPKKPECKAVQPDSKIGFWFREARCIPAETLTAYKIAEQGSTIIYPLMWQGQCVMFKFRNLDAEQKGGKKKIWSNLSHNI